jgi:hypothetical protein
MEEWFAFFLRQRISQYTLHGNALLLSRVVLKMPTISITHSWGYKLSENWDLDTLKGNSKECNSDGSISQEDSCTCLCSCKTSQFLKNIDDKEVLSSTAREWVELSHWCKHQTWNHLVMYPLSNYWMRNNHDDIDQNDHYNRTRQYEYVSRSEGTALPRDSWCQSHKTLHAARLLARLKTFAQIRSATIVWSRSMQRAQILVGSSAILLSRKIQRGILVVTVQKMYLFFNFESFTWKEFWKSFTFWIKLDILLSVLPC